MCSQVYPEKDRAHALDKGEAIKLLKGGTSHCVYSRSIVSIVGLFCLYSRSLLTLTRTKGIEMCDRMVTLLRLY